MNILPEIGQKYRKYNRTVLHIRGFVDDQIIFRWFDKLHQLWVYDAVSIHLWQWLIEREYVKEIIK